MASQGITTTIVSINLANGWLGLGKDLWGIVRQDLEQNVQQDPKQDPFHDPSHDPFSRSLRSIISWLTDRRLPQKRRCPGRNDAPPPTMLPHAGR
ncbi:hypothetical protein CDD80_3546 [Ophiocordyceps camponoti-rufipedis]|uniref:Uncharacterized protein n=1 Tax=Ophiocordyceps camponoti-rufipedis TaxID=2004952 RepID=A0A2C5Z1U9_9HYPO|nr:hypothetical protein CDD80_3546 [Ophiocordyceps camponoti-rufipedis]